MSNHAITLLKRLRLNYPDRGLKAPHHLMPAHETVSLWREVDAEISRDAEFKRPPPLRCCYCDTDAPVGGTWIGCGSGRVSCGGRDCVAF